VPQLWTPWPDVAGFRRLPTWGHTAVTQVSSCAVVRQGPWTSTLIVTHLVTRHAEPVPARHCGIWPMRGPPLDANSWRRGHSWSLGQVAIQWQLAGGVLGRWRCCTSVLSGWRFGSPQLVRHEAADYEIALSVYAAVREPPSRRSPYLHMRLRTTAYERELQPGGVPSRSRACPSAAVDTSGATLQVDAGPGPLASGYANSCWRCWPFVRRKTSRHCRSG
jgi:hypothetical protein